MALNELIEFGNLKENIGVPSAIKERSARKTVFGNSKKANILGDVINTLHAKESRLTDSAVKKPLNTIGKECKQVSSSIVKGTPNKFVKVTATQTVEDDDEAYCSEDDCPQCINGDEEDLLTMFNRQREFRLNEDDINKLCLDPNPKERYAPPSPEPDYEMFCKALSLPVPSDFPDICFDHHDDDFDLSFAKLPPEYYADVIPVLD